MPLDVEPTDQQTTVVKGETSGMSSSNQMTYLRVILLTILWSALTNGTIVKPRTYEVQNVTSTCTSQTVKVRLDLNRPFQGVVYAKGYPLEKNCRSIGTGKTFVEIAIDTSGCGVRLVSIDDEKFTFRVSLNVQMDKFLQQITDLEVSATCSLSFNDMVYPRQITYNRQISRTGRNKVPDDEADGRREEVLSKIKTWMEIEGTSESTNINKVSVGEQTIVLIKSFLPENIAANVIDCYAYDGTKDVTQKLLDENGCPLDETIMPSLDLVKYDDENSESGNEITWEAGTDSSEKTISRTSHTQKSLDDDETEKARLQVVGAMFSAFKFPDTSNLHLRCSLQICKKVCPKVSCDSNSETVQERTGKSIKSRNISSVIDKIEVFNSVEVVAPGIDSDGYSTSQDGIETKTKTDDNTFCLSASKMAFSFAILGAVFLCGVLAALWTIMRNHLRKVNKIDGSEQILVVRDSPLNFTSSRNKMYHNWTYS